MELTENNDNIQTMLISRHVYTVLLCTRCEWPITTNRIPNVVLARMLVCGLKANFLALALRMSGLGFASEAWSWIPQHWHKLQEQNLGYVTEIVTQYMTYLARPTYEKGVVNVMLLKALAGLVIIRSHQPTCFVLTARQAHPSLRINQIIENLKHFVTGFYPDLWLNYWPEGLACLTMALTLMALLPSVHLGLSSTM